MNPLINMPVKTVTKREVEYKLDASNIVSLLKSSGLTIPDSAKVGVTIRVPGGGDWSNTELDIDESPVIVRVTTVEVTPNSDSGCPHDGPDYMEPR